MSPDTVELSGPVLEVWSAMGRPLCYLTGGWVRDHLLGRESIDLDLAVPADVEATRPLAAAAARYLRTGAHLLGRPPHSIWRVETSTLKVELWPMGGLDLDSDILRRDLTCNALVVTLPEGRLIDRVGGLEDIEQKRIRAVARGNLEDDPVRLLRAARFRAQLEGFEIEPVTAQWIARLSGRLELAPRARVGQELMLLTEARGARRGLESMLRLGLLRPAAPPGASPEESWVESNLDAATRLAVNREHPLPSALAQAAEAARLAFLTRAWRISDPRDVADYSWPRITRQNAVRAASMVEDAVLTARHPADRRRQLIHRAGEAFPALLTLAAAIDTDGDHAPYRRWWRQWRLGGEQLVRPRPLLDAAEICETWGIESGPRLGELMKMLTAAQISGRIRSPGGARRWLQRRLKGFTEP